MHFRLKTKTKSKIAAKINTGTMYEALSDPADTPYTSFKTQKMTFLRRLLKTSYS